MKTFLLSIWNAIQPIALIGCICTYLLGGGIVIYLGMPIDFLSFSLGFGIIFLMITSGQFLNTYFDWVFQKNAGMRSRKKNRRSNQPEDTDADQISPVTFLMFAITFLSIVAGMVVLLITISASSLPLFFFISLAFLIMILYAVPPLKLADSGYGELCEAFLVTNLAPAIAFVIQTGEIHRLLAMLTFPLTLLYLAMLLVFSLPAYANDLKYQKSNLMIRIGWSNGMNLHNILILFSYLLLGLANVMGLPWRLTWPVLLTLPLGIFQIVLMIGIARGGKPNWRILSFTAITLFLLTSYLMTYTLWVN